MAADVDVHRLAGLERPRQGRAALGLDRDDPRTIPIPGGDPAAQPAAADGRDDCVEGMAAPVELARAGALPRDDERIVECVQFDCAARRGTLAGGRQRVVVVRARDDDLGPGAA